MKNSFKIIIALVLLTILGCRSSGSTNDLDTTETLAVMMKQCQQIEPEGDVHRLVSSLCGCANKGEPMGQQRAICEKNFANFLIAYKDFVFKESSDVFSKNDGLEPSTEALQCARKLTDFRTELMFKNLLKRCERNEVTSEDLGGIQSSFSSHKNDQCWVMSHMDERGCIATRPCRDTGASHVNVLPLENITPGASAINEASSLKLCHQKLTETHRLKDGSLKNINHNYAFANLLAFGRSYEHVTYGPANCHGTAAAIAGDFLKTSKVARVTYHSEAVRKRCESKAKKIFANAQKLSTETMPEASFFPIKKGGYIINMNHNLSCSSSSCGEVSYNVKSCDSEVLGHIFIDGMCVNCWHQQLELSGYRKLDQSQGWQALKPGCILTTADHSVTVLMKNRGMYYYYESTTPFGPPLLRVSTCFELFAEFKSRHCPRRPLMFKAN